MTKETIKCRKEDSRYFRLFIGFRKLGGFVTINEAKQYAGDSGLTGFFNLIGDSYRDSWYISTVETNTETERESSV